MKRYLWYRNVHCLFLWFNLLLQTGLAFSFHQLQGHLTAEEQASSWFLWVVLASLVSLLLGLVATSLHSTKLHRVFQSLLLTQVTVDVLQLPCTDWMAVFLVLEILLLFSDLMLNDYWFP